MNKFTNYSWIFVVWRLSLFTVTHFSFSNEQFAYAQRTIILNYLCSLFSMQIALRIIVLFAYAYIISLLIVCSWYFAFHFSAQTVNSMLAFLSIWIQRYIYNIECWNNFQNTYFNCIDTHHYQIKQKKFDLFFLFSES